MTQEQFKEYATKEIEKIVNLISEDKYIGLEEVTKLEKEWYTLEENAFIAFGRMTKTMLEDFAFVVIDKFDESRITFGELGKHAGWTRYLFTSEGEDAEFGIDIIFYYDDSGNLFPEINLCQ